MANDCWICGAPDADHTPVERAACHLQASVESYGEIETQHRSETYAFGDSWPGAQIELRERREAIVAFAREHGLANPFAPYVPPPAAAPAAAIADDDIPF